MSRVGKRPISVPSGIKIEVKGRIVGVEGKGKTVQHVLPDGFTAELNGAELIITRPSDSAAHRALHGTTRSLIQNIITGLNSGFQKKLEIQGVGYKAQIKGKELVLEIGFSHSVKFSPPEGITIETPAPTQIVVKGPDKQQVGQVAADIRGFYPPEPYKGKGIRYEGEYVRQKQGKSVA
ncbi:MAG: 50S ribosomal protein L6 [Candidatus Omnitrophota bacterium]